MASRKHIELANYIKNVHKKLREDSKANGHEKAWTKHCEDEEKLKKYSAAMEELATKHWQPNQEKEESKAFSRITWIHERCVAYFKEGGITYQANREQVFANRMDLPSVPSSDYEASIKLKLLDVGSCYNPLKKYDLFDILPIDLAPANEEVQQCDFLNLKISDHPQDIDVKSKILKLQRNSFDIVVFSLLLEYMPSADQRMLCCENAYNLLKSEGILIIITPDAKHVNANTKYMKSWRFVLAKIGFSRIIYEKLTYLHCMVFRKSLDPNYPKRWAVLQENRPLFDKIYIPQDFNSKEEEEKG